MREYHFNAMLDIRATIVVTGKTATAIVTAGSVEIGSTCYEGVKGGELPLERARKHLWLAGHAPQSADLISAYRAVRRGMIAQRPLGVIASGTLEHATTADTPTAKRR